MVKDERLSSHHEVLEQTLMNARSQSDLLKAIVNAPFSDQLLCVNLDLGIIVLLLVNKSTNTIDRVALSDTDLAKGAVRVSAKPFHEIHIPRFAKNNSIVEALDTGRYKITQDWKTLFAPVLTPEQARQNQQGASIECSLVWPLTVLDGGALIFSFYQPMEHISESHLAFVRHYAKIVEKSLSRHL